MRGWLQSQYKITLKIVTGRMTITLATPLTLWWHWRQHRRNSSNSSNKTSERIATSKFWRIWRESACSSISRWTDNKLSTRIFLEYNWSGKSKERKALANWTRIFGKWTLERGTELFDSSIRTLWTYVGIWLWLCSPWTRDGMNESGARLNGDRAAVTEHMNESTEAWTIGMRVNLAKPIWTQEIGRIIRN